jgi:hypothetical protein
LISSECGERQLNHSDGEAEKFYRELQQRGVSVRVGMEATGHSRWFERLLVELGIEVWIGDAAEIKRQRVRKQKTDREDARLMRKLLLENRFPRIWVPSPEIAFEPIASIDGQGFYLEDMFLITKNGTELLTRGVPYSAEEIEAAMH